MAITRSAYHFPLSRHALLFLAVSALVLTWLTFLISGYDPQLRSGVLHIPMLKAMLDDSLYPNDYNVRLKNYPSLLWSVTAALAHVFDLSSVMFWLCQLQNFLFHFSAALLAYILCGNVYWSTAVSSYFLLVPRAIIGGSIFYDSPRLSHGTFSIPFVLLSLSMVLVRRPALAFACWIVALMIHIPNGVFALPLLIGATLYPYLRQWDRLPISAKRLLWGALFLTGVTVSLGFWFLIQRDSSSISWDLYKRLTGLGLGGTSLHIFWSANVIPPTRVLSFAMQEVFIASSMFYVWRHVRRLRSLVFGFVLLHVSLVMGVIGESLQSVNVTRLMWIRAADQMCVIGLITAFAISAHPRIIRNRSFAAAIVVMIYVAICMAPSHTWLYCVASLYFLAAAVLRAPAHQRSTYERIVYPLLAAAFAACIVNSLHFPKEQAKTLASPLNTPQYDAFRAAQVWARSNTSKAAVFLTPPEMYGWRLYSERSSFLEMRDRVAVVLTDETAKEFVRRSGVLEMPVGDYTNPRLFDYAYRRLTDSQLLNIGKRENIAFALVARDKPTSLPVCYSNNYYTMVRLIP